MPDTPSLSSGQRIDGLPPRLADVPPGPDGEFDPLAAAKRVAWLRWRDGVLAYRAERRSATADDAPDRDVQRAIELGLCMRDPAYFVAVWCAVKETRLVDPDDDEAPGWQPAVPYPFQVALLRWIEERVRLQKTGLVSKSRDMGATWLCCLWTLHGWLFKKAFTAKFVSRSKEEVYSRKDDAMFSRLASQFDRQTGAAGGSVGNGIALPRWLWPAGFDPAAHVVDAVMSNPANGNEVNGEATSMRTGRGGRGTVVVVDELAFVEDARHVFGTLRATAGARIGVSTESIEVSDDFCEMARRRRAAGDGSVLDLDWWLHPEHGRAWMQAIRREYEDDGNLDAFFREVLRDAAAGLSSWAYPAARDRTVGTFPYVPGSPVWVAIDPGFDDECALHWLSRDAQAPERVRLLRSYANRGKPPEFYAALVLGLALDARDDPDIPWRYGDPEEDLAGWAATLLKPSLVYGDPAGGQHTTGRKESWYDRMAVFWAKHGWVKAVSYKGMGVDARPFQTRRTALMTLLPRLDFHDGPGVRETLLAVAESRFDQSDDRVTEQKALRHDKGSHRRSALEFFAVWHPKTSALIGSDYAPIKRKRAA